MQYTREEQEEFDREFKKRMKQIIEDNESRFHDEPAIGRHGGTDIPEDVYIANMIATWERKDKEKRTGKKSYAYSPEYGYEEI